MPCIAFSAWTERTPEPQEKTGRRPSARISAATASGSKDGERMHHRAGNVAAVVFVRLAHVDHQHRPVGEPLLDRIAIEIDNTH